MYRFLPYWIMLAPVAFVLFDWMRMPKPMRHRSDAQARAVHEVRDARDVRDERDVR